MSTSPLMRHLVQQHQTLIAELETLGAAAPVELASVANLLPPVAQDVIDRLSRHVATLRDAHRRPEDPAAAPVADPLKAAREWLRDAPPRATADNVNTFAKDLNRHMHACGFTPSASAYSVNAKRTEFAAWILEQVPA